MKKHSVFRNYLYNMAYSVMGVLFPMIILPYISRILLPVGLGQVSYAQNIISYFILVASMGIPNYGIREIARNAQNVQRRSQVFLEIFLINFMSTVFATVIYYLLIFRVEYFAERRLICSIVGISLALNVLNIDWFYKGLEEFRYITIRSYIIKMVSVLAIFFWVRSENDVNIYALILTLATSANYIFNILHVKKYIVFPKCDLNLKIHLEKIFYLFATAAAVELYAQLDVTMIGLICGEAFVGYYSCDIRIIRIIAVIITSLSNVLLPRLSVYYQEKKLEQINVVIEKVLEYILFISFPCAVGLILESETIIRCLFGEAFLPAIVTMRILAFMIPILSVGNVFGTQLLIALNQEKKLTKTVIIGVIVNITLNSFMIKAYQQNGAAVASVVAELAVMIAQIILTSPYVKIKFNYKLFIKIMIQIFIMIIVVIFIKKLYLPWGIKLVVSVVSGLIAYILSGLVLKNEIIIEIISFVAQMYLPH